MPRQPPFPSSAFPTPEPGNWWKTQQQRGTRAAQRHRLVWRRCHRGAASPWGLSAMAIAITKGRGPAVSGPHRRPGAIHLTLRPGGASGSCGLCAPPVGSLSRLRLIPRRRSGTVGSGGGYETSDLARAPAAGSASPGGGRAAAMPPVRTSRSEAPARPRKLSGAPTWRERQGQHRAHREGGTFISALSTQGPENASIRKPPGCAPISAKPE